MKRKTLLISLLVILITIMATGTLSYFTRQGKATNVITSGNIKMELLDIVSEELENSEQGILMLPGDTVSKTVSAKNTGNHPFYLRIKVTKEVNDEQLDADESISLNINTDDWTYKDGLYYYNRELNPGETTPALFTEVSMNGKQVDNQYLGKYFTVDVTAYAVQSDNNGNTVWEAFGWPE